MKTTNGNNSSLWINDVMFGYKCLNGVPFIIIIISTSHVHIFQSTYKKQATS